MVMECRLETAQGDLLALPRLLSWQFCYGLGEPCDSFRAECVWSGPEDPRLGQAVRFHAFEGGEKRFTGVVDEYELLWDREGGRLRLYGRGLEALLLDNEAKGADYQIATPADLIRDHVTPYGIRTVGGEDLPAVPGFSVEGGSSEWKAVRRFALYHGGVEPRFDGAGRLVLTPLPDRAQRHLGREVPITTLVRRGKRYGVLSEVLVRDRTGRGESRVVNEPFRREGICRRAVLTLPRKSTYETMRYNGAYQLRASAREREGLELRSPLPFLALPGELLEVALERQGTSGLWRVRETETGLDENGTYSQLRLFREERG